MDAWMRLMEAWIGYMEVEGPYAKSIYAFKIIENVMLS